MTIPHIHFRPVSGGTFPGWSAAPWRLRRAALVLLLLFVCPTATWAQGSPYTTAPDGNGGVIITQYTGSDSAVAIPSTITVAGVASPVTGIGPDAFYGSASVTSVTIPDSVTVIGNGAFSYVNALTHVTIGNGVTSIGDNAFSTCPVLASVTIGNHVTRIGDFAFQDCSLLAGVTIPASVTTIGQEAFISCTDLATVSIGSNVQTIGSAAFSECTKLTSVAIPASVTSIGLTAFNGCSKLTAINVPAQNTVYSSINGVLFNASQTTLIQYPGGKAGSYTIPSNVTSIGDFAFAGTGVTSVALPSGVLALGQGAFGSCASLSSITIPASVASLGDYAFSNCTNLTSAVFLGNAPTMGDLVFFDTASNFTASYYDNATGFATPYWTSGNGSNVVAAVDVGTSPAPIPANLLNAGPFTVMPDFNGGLVITGYTGAGGAVVIPDTITLNNIVYPVTRIESNAFSNCSTLIAITIPNGVTSMGSGAFAGCTNLTTVNMGNGITEIGGGAFAGCTSLSSMVIGSGVTTIDESAFQGCTGLTSLTLPNSLTTLQVEAFTGCTSLTSVTIPASVTTMGTFVFSGCSSLTSAIFLGNAPSLPGADFDTTANGFTMYYYDGATGFTSPTTAGYRAVDLGSIRGVSLGGNLAFGLVQTGTSVTSVMTIVNSGSSPITVGSIDYPVGFSGNWSSGQIPAGGAQSVTVTFAPTSVASYGGSITVNSVGQVSANSIAVSGLGINPAPYTIATDGNGGIVITGYTGAGGALVIPGTIDGLTVTGIANYAFENQRTIISVTIPDSVTSIGSNAFMYCEGLTSVNLGQGVTTIHDFAFFLCPLLQTVSIPSSVTSIGFNAFSQCNLRVAYFSGNAPTLQGNVFSSEATGFKIVYNNAATGYTTPTWAPDVGDTYPTTPFFVFTMSNGQITLTGYNGPGGALALSTINGLPIVAISGDVFYGLNSLTSISIPASLTSISPGTLTACPNLTSITVDPANPVYSSVGGILFNKNQTTLLQYPGGDAGTYTIPSSVTTIGQGAFQGASQLTGVTIPTSVTDIGPAAFGNCAGLTHVTIPASVTTVEEAAFLGCANLTNVLFQGAAPTMGGYVFFNDGFGKGWGFTVSYHLNATGFTAPVWTPDADDSYASVVVMNFTQWTTSQGLPSSTTAMTNDGVPNLLKFLYGINPGTSMSASDRSALPTVDTATVQNVPCLTLTYRRNLAAGVTVQVQTSTDMQSWTTISNPTIVQTAVDATTGDPMMQVQVPIASSTQFIRLSVAP